MDIQGVWSKDRGSESGSIIVFASMVLIAIFAMIALAIDGSRALHAQSQKLYVADLAATAGIEAYMEREPDPSVYAGAADDAERDRRRHQWKLSQAALRVMEIGRVNILTEAGEAHLSNLSDLTTHDKGILRSGRWWSSRPAECDVSAPAETLPCPCALDPVSPRPCMQYCDPASGCVNPGGTGKPFANALEVTLFTKADQGIKGAFTRIFSLISMVPQSDIQVKGTSIANARQSIAYALPKYGVILFDLSRYAAVDNYKPFEKTPASPREYSFKLSSPGACDVSANPCGSGCTVDEGRGYTAAASFGYQHTYDLVADKSQYKCFALTNNGVSEQHLVNMSPAPADRPQPLTTLLSALNAALMEIKNSSSPADRIALVGYDDEILEERVIDFVATGDEEFQRMLDITSSPQKAAENFFFPRTDSRSDLPRALKKAYEMLKDVGPLDRIDPYVMLLTNGLTNCEAVTAPDAPKCGRYPVPADLPGVKKELYQIHLLSLEESLGRSVAQYFKPNKIRLHIAAAGQAVAPHIALIPNPADGGRCFDEEKLRSAGYLGIVPEDELVPGVHENSYLSLGSDGAAPYTQPNTYLYAMATLAQSKWIPLREECAVSTPEDVDNLCRSQSHPLPLFPAQHERKRKTRENAARPLDGSAEVDSEGRLLCRPRGAGPIAGEVRKKIKEINERRPVRLVAENLL